MSRNVFANKPMKDDWDVAFLQYVRKNIDSIIERKNDATNTAFQDYYQRYTSIEGQWHAQEQKTTITGKKKYMGIISHADDANALRYAIERKFNNRSSVDLTDLHELYLCADISPNTLFGIHAAETIVQLEYITERDILKLGESINIMPLQVPFVVRCIPLLGLYLTVHSDFNNSEKRLFYQIVDSFGMFSWNETTPSKSMHAYRIKDPQTFSSKDMKMHDSIIGIYKNALSVFNAHCSLAMGILDTRNKQPMDRYGALDQRTQAGDLFIRKIARFFGLDPENKSCYSSYSSTNFEKLQNTISLLMKDVSDMATAQTAFEKARAEQIAKEKENDEQVKKGLNNLINGASQQNRTKSEEKA